MTLHQMPAPWQTKAFKPKPIKGGYAMLYHKGEVNHCPGCGGTHWLVGRVSAECARCDTALPLAEQAYEAPQPMQEPFLVRLFDRLAAGGGV